MSSAARARPATEVAAPEYILELFISGVSARSQRALGNLQAVCERHLAGRYRIDVVDLYQSPGLARERQIIATPTLLKLRPAPFRRVFGDLSQIDKLLQALDIPGE